MSEVAQDYVEQQIVKKEVVYLRPSLFRRVMANLIDLILLLIATFLILLGAREIVNRTPGHLTNLHTVESMRVDSGLYVEAKGKIVSTSSYLKSNLDIPTEKKRMELAVAYIEGLDNAEYNIDGFLNYCSAAGKGSDELYKTVKKDYDKYRLDQIFSGDNAHMFIRNAPTTEFPEGEVVRNESCQAEFKDYSNIYYYYMDNVGVGILSTSFPEYRNAMRTLSLDLFAIEIPVSFALAGILVYFIPPLFFKRGRKTLGKLAYKIGVVNAQCLNISFKQYLLRFTIFYFAILLLSLVTFAVPVIISFTMMVFSKGKQSFQDYLLGLFEVDTSGAKIYYTLEEAEVDQFETAKKPVDFKRVERE